MKKGAGSAMDVQLKDILVMKKTHPCGGRCCAPVWISGCAASAAGVR